MISKSHGKPERGEWSEYELIEKRSIARAGIREIPPADHRVLSADGAVADASLKKDLYSVGLTYKPVERVSLKLEYRNFETDGEKKTADEVMFGAGVAF